MYDLLKTLALTLLATNLHIAAMGLCWLFVYLLIVRQGMRDRRYGMPALALACNLAWEGTFIFAYPFQGLIYWLMIPGFALDLIIFYQFLRFGRRDFPLLRQGSFITVSIIGFGLVWFLLPYLIKVSGDIRGLYSGMIINLLVSVSFLYMLKRRRDRSGQSMAIAWLKLLGTFFAYLVVIRFTPWYFAHPVYALILWFDILYVRQLARSPRPIDSKVFRYLGNLA